MVLNRQGKAAAALPQVERLLADEPRNPGYRNLKAAVLANLGDYAESIEVYEAVLGRISAPAQDLDELRTRVENRRPPGRQRRRLPARASRMQPTLGEAYWSLANLKTFRFSDADDVARMRSALARDDLADEDRLHFEFALGKALEDAGALRRVLRRITRAAMRSAAT